jgi:hypothetical protein
VQVHERRVAARLRIAVRHADDGAFLQAEHVLEIRGKVAEQRQFGRARIAE